MFDARAFESSLTKYSSDIVKTRVLSSSESIIYCMRRGKQQVIPPLHLGLSLLVWHKYGSRDLIGILHSCGICVSYDELRRFLTSAVMNQNKGVTNGFLPSGIIERSKKGLMIQEGDDNIDINTETIDGKNTYHSMARVLFQNVNINDDFPDNIIRIERIE